MKIAKILLESFVLPMLAVAFINLVVLNPLGFDAPSRLYWGVLCWLMAYMSARLSSAIGNYIAFLTELKAAKYD